MIAAALPDWPEWALNLLITMSISLAVVFAITSLFKNDANDKANNKTAGEGDKKLEAEFKSFRRQYIAVYLVIMLADWMQGTHMYTLYLSYNVNISALFLTGFLSGAIFAPFLGSAVDQFGRKRSCIVYCVLEIIINVLEHFDDFPTLIIGRILGGISTNLLFSAFESWMTTEHHKRGFPESWLSITFSAASIGNGSMAIVAGILAQLLEDRLGHIGPFQGAIALTVLALFMVMGWEENYGEKEEGEHSNSSLYQQFVDGWKMTCSDSQVWRIGLTQALSEGAMYTFVFMWVPTLLSQDPPGGLPTGCVFSSLMMAITIGGVLFPPLQAFLGKYVVSESNKGEMSATLTYGLGSISMAVPALCLSTSKESCFDKLIWSFILVEVCVGLFMPVAGTLRSKYIPDSLHGGILNIFRLPLNIVVVLGTYATDFMEAHNVFFIVSGCFMAAAVIQATMVTKTGIVGTSKKTD